MVFVGPRGGLSQPSPLRSGCLGGAQVQACSIPKDAEGPHQGSNASAGALTVLPRNEFLAFEKRVYLSNPSHEIRET